MSGKQYLEQDIAELTSRISGSLVVLESDGKECSKETSILVIPTLAERHYSDEARGLFETLYAKVDLSAFWQSIYLLEAASSLKLRGIELKDVDTRIVQCVDTVLKLCENRQTEDVLRAARAIVIAGLALKDSIVVENGLVQARKAVETAKKWSKDLDKALHALISLVDLYKISNDEATLILIQDRTKALELSAESMIEQSVDPDLLSRFGVVAAKLDEKKDAEALYVHVCKGFSPKEITTSALKYRIELGARLYGDEVKHQVRFEKEETQEIRTADEGISFENIQLPAEKAGDFEQPLVSVIVIQQDSSGNVTETVSALLGQSVVPDELVILWNGKGRSLNLPDYNGSLVQITIDRISCNYKAWQMGVAASSGKWVWMLKAGQKPKSDVLEKIVPFKADNDLDALYLSCTNGELQDGLNNLEVRPSIRSERVLVKRDILAGISKELKINSEVFWAFALDKLGKATWKEVVYKKGDPFDKLNEIESSDQIGDASEIFRNFKARRSEVRRRRDRFIEETRSNTYRSYQEKSLPLVSIIIDTLEEGSSADQVLESVLRNTNHIPFEIITTSTTDHSKQFIDTLNELGIMNIQVNKSENSSQVRNKAASEAKGVYLVFLGKDAIVQENWLNNLIQPLEVDHSNCITGGMIHTQKGTILHSGIAFEEKSVPHRLHFGGSILQKTVLNPRKFQALEADFFMIRSDFFEQSEGFFDSFESPLNVYDLCLTARSAGKGIMYVPNARAIMEKLAEFSMNDEWHRKWDGRIEADLHLYAKIDGYDVEKSSLKPKGKSIPVQNVEVHSNSDEQDTAKVIHKEPEHTERDFVQLLVKAESQIKDGNYDSAEDILNQARSQVNGNVTNRVQYWTLLGDARFRLDKPDEAFECYQKAVEDNPAAQRAWIGIGTYHLVQGELEKAEEIFDKVITQNPENLRGYLGRGNVKLQKQSPAEALMAFQKAANLDPGYRPTIVGLVAAALQAEKMQEALPSLEKYLEIHDDDIEARFHLAAIYYGVSRLDSALVETNRVLEVSPNHPGAKELMVHLKEGGKS
jgi:tetratricopeptide (TPR) repeat protein